MTHFQSHFNINQHYHIQKYWLPWLITATLVGLFTTVFIFSPYYMSPTVFPRLLYFFKISILLNLTTIFASCFQKRVLFTKTDILIISFTAYIFIHFWLTQSHAYERLSTILLLSNLYFALRLLDMTWNRMKQTVYLLLIITGIGESCIGYLQIYGIISSFHQLQPLTGTFFNPGPLSAYLGALLCMALVYIIKYHKEFSLHSNISQSIKATYYTTIVFIIVCLPLIPATMSRSAWVAITLTFIITLLNEYKATLHFYLKRVKKITLYIIGIGVLLLLLSGLSGIYLLKKDSADARLHIWQNCLQMTTLNPFWGTGVGSFQKLYTEIQAENLASPEIDTTAIHRADHPLYPFNEYLFVLIELGPIGLLLFIGCLLCAFKGIRQHSSVFQYGLLNLCIFACTSYPLQILPIQILAVVCLALHHTDKTTHKNAFPIFVYRIIPGVGLLILILSWPYFKQRASTLLQWSQLQQIFYQNGHFDKIVESYPPLFPQLKDDIQYLFEYGRSLNMTGSYAQSNEILERISLYMHDPMAHNIMGNNFKHMGNIQAALKQYRTAHYYMPNHIYPLYLIAMLYYETGDTTRFVQSARLVLDFEPKIESSATQELKNEIRKFYKQCSQKAQSINTTASKNDVDSHCSNSNNENKKSAE